MVILPVALCPVERALRAVWISQVMFDEPVTLLIGDTLMLQDLNGLLYTGVVEDIEPGKYCDYYCVGF